MLGILKERPEIDDFILRSIIVSSLFKMRYGGSCVVPGSAVRHAFRPTGEHDRSPEAFFRAMSLAAGGNRPETSYTTDERITNDLDGSFEWYERPQDGDYEFRRLLRHCPKCKGRGYFEAYAPLSPLYDPSASPMMDEAVTIDRKECDHRPDAHLGTQAL